MRAIANLIEKEMVLVKKEVPATPVAQVEVAEAIEEKVEAEEAEDEEGLMANIERKKEQITKTKQRKISPISNVGGVISLDIM